MWKSTTVTLVTALLCGAAAAAEKECVPLGATAPAWDHVTTCKDWYAVLTNGDARVADDAASSVSLTDVDASTVTSLESCATLCFETNKCQWFKFDGKCSLFQHLALRQASGSGRRATTQLGFLLSGDADFLNQNVDPSQLFQLGGVSFYRTKDVSNGETISMYLPSAEAKCVASAPLTLFRAYHNNYETASMIAKAESGETINAMDKFFTLDSFLAALKAGPQAPISVPTDAVDITSSGDVVRTGAAGSTYTYRLDRFGRVVDVSAPMNFTNVLRKPGRPGENRKGASIRTQYCANAYQQRFNVVQQLQAATSAKLAFQAGHLMACQFTNPHGFFNFVPQAAKSNAMNGCWYNTELGTSRLLKMGCEGVFRARLTYLSTPGELTEVSSLTGPLLSPSDAAAIYTTGAGASLVQRPCGYWFRPVKMSLDFTITGASAGSRCSAASSVLQDNQGKFFATDAATTGGMRVSRAFAHWFFDSASFNRLRGMGAADWRANQCYAETGKLAAQLAFDNSFDRVLLKLKSSASSASAPQCVAVINGALELSSCDVAAARLRWTGSGASDNIALSNGASPACIAVRGNPAACLALRFQYAKPSVAFSGSKANIKLADELVDGTVLASASQCLAVSGTAVTLKPSGSSDCAVVQATYVLDDGADDGDDE
ncbi:hypothetical protein ATCC90586_009969 [Pythium insidiosum]|nr:hypothetical protein ATCC90586_009969 [Pythium insidiosum]